MTAEPTTEPAIADQAPKLLGHIAGYVAHRCIGLGLRAGLLAELADAPGLTADELAERCRLDPFYVWVWCRGTLAAGVLERDDNGGTALSRDARYRLAPHMATLLLDRDSPAYMGAVFSVLLQPEIFERFEQTLASGERMWWEDTSPEWIRAVSGSGRPFYTRLVPAGLDQVPGLAERLRDGCRVVDTACGTGTGLLRLAEHYPRCELVGVDGDVHSLDQARAAVAAAGLDQVELVRSPLEEMTLDRPAAVVINNISMHECRDIDEVTRRVHDTLEPGGWFVISDFPFADNEEALQTPPGRVMSGIQFFEAQIDDQLLPRSTYDELLARHGFTDVGHVALTPMHAVTWGRRV
ncbi:hypothetical protein GCM10023169_12670 [Georgenia halophila]|uniref:Methyltransferase domain-containing protein n=1 Tax=Georgenia halophila TaxID=620889 RepID=A0ABP8KWC3_9MICO